MAPTRRILYQIITYPPLPPNLTPEQVTESRWHQPWSEPVRPKRGIANYLQQSFTSDPVPFPTTKNMGWYNWLADPVRKKPGLGAHLNQFDPYQVPVQPVVSTLIQWFAPLSVPVRIRPGLWAADQQFFFFEPEPPEAMEIEWYAWLSQPVRLKPGLKAPYQQFLAYHPRILPNPNVTVRMAATETNSDIFLAAVNVYSGGGTTAGGSEAKVSVVETGPGGGPASIEES